MTPRSLADLIVTEYVEFYSDYDRTAGRSADLAAIDLARMDDLGAEIDELAKCLTRAAEPDLVTLSHWSAQTYKADQFVDLHDFCMQAYSDSARIARLDERARGVIEVFDGDTDALAAFDKGEALTTRGGGCIVRSGCSGFAHQHSYRPLNLLSVGSRVSGLSEPSVLDELVRQERYSLRRRERERKLDEVPGGSGHQQPSRGQVR